MRAVTWTQVAQYVLLILAFLLPVSWLSYQQTGNPIAPFAYGQQLQKITQLEEQILHAPAEQEVIAIYQERVRQIDTKLGDVEAALRLEKRHCATNSKT